MYTYKCNSCGSSLKTLSVLSKCPSCSSKSIYMESDTTKTVLIAGDGSSTVLVNSHNYKYKYHCYNCGIDFRSTGLSSICASCLSGNIKLISTDTGNPGNPTTPEDPGNTVPNPGDPSDPGNKVPNPSDPTTPGTPEKHQFKCGSCNHSFTSITIPIVCTRCSSTNLKIKDGDRYVPIDEYDPGDKKDPIGGTPGDSPGNGDKPGTNPGNPGGGGPTNPGTDPGNGGTNPGNPGSPGGGTPESGKPEDGTPEDGGSEEGGEEGGTEGGDAESKVNAFYEKFYTTAEDELEVIESFENQDSGSLKNSIYGGQWGVFTASDGKPEDPDLAATYQAMEDTSGEITENVYMEQNIFGLPLFYNAFADPCKGVYNKSILYDLPIVSIIPGKPKVNRKLINTDGNKIVDLDEYYNKTDGDTENVSGDWKFGILGPKNEDDMRYMSFVDNYGEYWKYVNFLTSYVHNWLIASQSETWQIQTYNFDSKLKNKYNGRYGLTFYMDKSSQISESASNTYGTSRIADMVNGETTTTREASMVGKYGSFTELTTKIAETIGSTIEGTTSAIDSLKSFEGILRKTANSLMKVVNGAQLDFPEIWQDSRFERSYSLSFRFYSPYGDRASIEKFVYTPFLALLALTLPRQDQAFSYVEPFLIRAYCPGWFNIDCGYISSMTINKGGADNLWTADGLPRLMEVTIDIQDLYPVMKQLSKGGMTKYNKGLCSYLENLSGVRAEDLTLGTMANMKLNKITNSLLTTFDNRIKNFWDSWGWDGYKMNEYVKNLLAR